MFKVIMLGIYLGSVALFAFVVFCGIRAAIKHGKEMVARGYTFKKGLKKNPVASLRLALMGLVPVVNTFCAIALLLAYEGFEDDMIMEINRKMEKKEG
jgi:hypothetical protein